MQPLNFFRLICSTLCVGFVLAFATPTSAQPPTCPHQSFPPERTDSISQTEVNAVMNFMNTKALVPILQTTLEQTLSDFGELLDFLTSSECPDRCCQTLSENSLIIATNVLKSAFFIRQQLEVGKGARETFVSLMNRNEKLERLNNNRISSLQEAHQCWSEARVSPLEQPNKEVQLLLIQKEIQTAKARLANSSDFSKRLSPHKDDLDRIISYLTLLEKTYVLISEDFQSLSKDECPDKAKTAQVLQNAYERLNAASAESL